MKPLTTPQAILTGFVLVALAIASIPYSSNILTPAYAKTGVQKVVICNPNGVLCASVLPKAHISKEGEILTDGHLMTGTTADSIKDMK